MKKVVLDKKELKLEREINNGEWVPVPNMTEEIKKYQSYARDALKKSFKKF